MEKVGSCKSYISIVIMHKHECVQILPKLKPLHQINYPLDLFLDKHLLFHIGKKIDFDFCAGCLGTNQSQRYYDFDFVFLFQIVLSKQ